MKRTYAKVLDVIQDVVIEGKVTAGDNVDTSIFLDLPVSKAKSLGLSEKLSLRELPTPV